MILFVVGLAFLALGLFSGASLVAAPLGWFTALNPGVSIWFFFPAFSILGLILVIIGGKAAHIRKLSLAASSFLLGLALLSAVGLVLAGMASSAAAPIATISLWYVFAVAGVLGAVGVAACSRTEEPVQTSA